MADHTPKPRAVSPFTLADILRKDKGDWIIVGGKEMEGIGTPLAVHSVRVTKRQLALTVGQHPSQFTIRLAFGDFTVTRGPEAHTIQVHRLYMQTATRAEVDGGGTHILPVPGVQLLLRNPSLKAQLEEEKAQAARNDQQRRAAQRKAAADRLDVIGATIDDVAYSEDYKTLTLHFREGGALRIRGETIHAVRLMKRADS